jgi:hypothetical protein
MKSSNNPTRNLPDWRLVLPLAHACPRCGAKTRSGHPCRSAAMRNGRCRMHGGASPGAPRGERHGMFRHGLRTIEAIEERRATAALIRELRRNLAMLGATCSVR